MEAVLQGPRIYIRGNVFGQAKDFFTNIFNRRKLKSKVKADKMAVKNTNARVISVEQTINALSSIFSLEAIVKLYEQRIENANKRINELKIKINNCADNEKERLQKELDNYIENLKVDSYILESKKEELDQENKKNIEPNEQPEAPKAPEPNEPSGQNEPPQNDPKDESQEENKEYVELYSSIKSLFEDKINLSSVRLERITNITNFINNINVDDLQDKLTYITYFNKSFISNYEKEISVDQQLNEKIKKIYEIKPDFNINEEFGELTRRVAILSNEMIRNYENAILGKINYLHQIIYSIDPSEHEIIRELVKELDKSLNNLKYNTNEPNKVETTTEEKAEQSEPPKEPKPNEPTGQNEAFENDNQTENEEKNKEYEELYNSIKSLFEDKINLSSNQVKIIERLTNFIKNKFNVDIPYLEGCLNRFILINIDFENNYDEEVKIDRLLNEKIKKIYEIKLNFSINEEFGELTSQIVAPSEVMIHNCEKNILAKKYYLEEIVRSKNSYDHETIRSIIKVFDKLLSNLKNYISEPNKLETIMEEIAVPLLEDKTSELVVDSVDNNETNPEEQPVQLKKTADKVQEETPDPTAESITSPTQKTNQADELKERLLTELKKQYSKINSINDLLSNPLKMTCEATIYFEKIASDTDKKIIELKAKLHSMSNVFSYELENQEVFPGTLEGFIKIHKEKTYRANDELKALQEKEEKKEKDLKRIDTLNRYLATEKEIVERRLIFEKKRDSELNYSDYLSQFYSEYPFQKEEQPVSKQPESEEPVPVIIEQHVEKPKLSIAKPQKVNRERATIGKYKPYTVERLKDSIRIIINNQARQELKKALGDIKVIINNKQGLNGVKVNIDKTKDGNIIENISNLDNLDNLKIVIENNGQEVKSEEIVGNSMSK